MPIGNNAIFDPKYEESYQKKELEGKVNKIMIMNLYLLKDLRVVTII